MISVLSWLVDEGGRLQILVTMLTAAVMLVGRECRVLWSRVIWFCCGDLFTKTNIFNLCATLGVVVVVEVAAESGCKNFRLLWEGSGRRVEGSHLIWFYCHGLFTIISKTNIFNICTILGGRGRGLWRWRQSQHTKISTHCIFCLSSRSRKALLFMCLGVDAVVVLVCCFHWTKDILNGIKVNNTDKFKLTKFPNCYRFGHAMGCRWNTSHYLMYLISDAWRLLQFSFLVRWAWREAHCFPFIFSALHFPHPW